MRGKLTTLAESVARVSDGSSITFSGFAHSGHPMAFVRELIRQGRCGLHLMAVAECWAAELLVAADAVSTIRMSNLMFEGLGRCYAIAQGAESGQLRIEDHSHLAMALRLAAGGWGMPFLPIRSMTGTEIATRTTFDDLKISRVGSPFRAEDVSVVGPLQPDVAVVHVSKCDAAGNCQLPGTRAVIDLQVRSAARVIVTAEEIVPEAEIMRTPEQTVVPGLLVDEIIHVPFGAHPTGMYRYYDDDFVHLRTYHARSKDPAGRQEYLDTYVRSPEDHFAYLDLIGVRRLMELRSDPFLGYRPGIRMGD